MGKPVAAMNTEGRGTGDELRKGVFLDRDGVINRLVLNPRSRKFESPYRPEEFEILPDVPEALRRLFDGGFLLFLVSNQPSSAKGTTTLAALEAVHAKMHGQMLAWNIPFSRYYYCHHHPAGIVSELAILCRCRKPGTLFLEQARDDFKLDLAASWMIGDRDTDIECGRQAGVKTIFIDRTPQEQRSKIFADFRADDLSEAADIIMRS